MADVRLLTFAGVGAIDEVGLEVPPQRGTVVTQGAS